MDRTLDGTHEQVTDTARAAVLDWSRDGRLAWLETENDGCRCKIAAWTADDHTIAFDATYGLLNTAPDNLWSLRWSPTGDALAGVFGGRSRLSHDDDVNEHFVVELDGGESPYVRAIGNPGGDAFPPAWSSDGAAVIGRAWVFDSESVGAANGMSTRSGRSRRCSSRRRSRRRCHPTSPSSPSIRRARRARRFVEPADSSAAESDSLELESAAVVVTLVLSAKCELVLLPLVSCAGSPSGAESKQPLGPADITTTASAARVASVIEGLSNGTSLQSPAAARLITGAGRNARRGGRAGRMCAPRRLVTVR